MALKRTKLLNVQSITGIATVGIFTVGTTATAAGTASTTYLRSVVVHNTGLSTSTASLYVYPNGVAASGEGKTEYRIARIDLATNDTYFVEFNYPIVMVNGDKLVAEVNAPYYYAGGTGIGTVMNFQIIGDTDI